MSILCYTATILCQTVQCAKNLQKIWVFYYAKLCPYCAIILRQFCAKLRHKRANPRGNNLSGLYTNCIQFVYDQFCIQIVYNHCIQFVYNPERLFPHGKCLKCVWFGHRVYPHFGTVLAHFGTILAHIALNFFSTG